MARKRSFGDLKVGSIIWTAHPASISRHKITHIDGNRIYFGWYSYQIQEVDMTKDCHENTPEHIYWYINKEDAIRKAVELQEAKIEETEQTINFMRQQLEYFKQGRIK